MLLAVIPHGDLIIPEINIQKEIIAILGSDFELKPHLKEALNHQDNKKLAEIGDSVLSLIVRIDAYDKPDSNPESMETHKQRLVTKRKMKEILNSDKEFTEYVIMKYGFPNENGIIGLNRSDALMEGLVGAIFLEKENESRSGFSCAQKFIQNIYENFIKN